MTSMEELEPDCNMSPPKVWVLLRKERGKNERRFGY
jgi:hypothetical protein